MRTARTLETAGEREERHALEAVLGAVARGAPLLAAATPRNAHIERARLLEDYRRGDERLPRWTYEVDRRAVAHSEQQLRPIIARLAPLGASPLARLLLARARELDVELDAAKAVGAPAFGALAARRFSPLERGRDADTLAETWCASSPPASEPAFLFSDDRDPSSLLSRMRAEVERRKLPFVVRTHPSLSPLAAVSFDTVWVAERRPCTRRSVERTVMHEIEAHAAPRARAKLEPLAILSLGTAQGGDDQEGYALWLEEGRGFLDDARKKELGARHRAVVVMSQGADFVTVVRELRSLSLPVDRALLIAERVFRGSDGTTPGLGRERVYLEAYLRVRARLIAKPEDEAVLSAGQVSVDALDTLRRELKTAKRPP